MDEIRKIARACYNGAAGTEKQLAQKLFRSLDTNGDGKVSLREYKMLKHASFSNSDFFKELDANSDGTLDFQEALALYYMDKVSVPACSACKSLLLHSYFSCLTCQADVSYYLCCDCYARGKFKHHHSSDEFFDTRAMLKLLDQILKHAQISPHKFNHLPQGTEGVDEEEDDDDDGEEDEGDYPYLIPDFVEGKKAKTKGKAAGNKSNHRHSKREKIVKLVEAIDVAVALGGTGVTIGTVAVATVAATTCCIM